MTSLTSLTDPTGYFAAIHTLAVAHHIPATIAALALSVPLAILLFGAEQAIYRCDFCGRQSTRKTYPGERRGQAANGGKVTAESVCEVCSGADVGQGLGLDPSAIETTNLKRSPRKP